MISHPSVVLAGLGSVAFDILDGVDLTDEDIIRTICARIDKGQVAAVLWQQTRACSFAPKSLQHMNMMRRFGCLLLATAGPVHDVVAGQWAVAGGQPSSGPKNTCMAFLAFLFWTVGPICLVQCQCWLLLCCFIPACASSELSCRTRTSIPWMRATRLQKLPFGSYRNALKIQWPVRWSPHRSLCYFIRTKPWTSASPGSITRWMSACAPSVPLIRKSHVSRFGRAALLCPTDSCSVSKHATCLASVFAVLPTSRMRFCLVLQTGASKRSLQSNILRSSHPCSSGCCAPAPFDLAMSLSLCRFQGGR